MVGVHGTGCCGRAARLVSQIRRDPITDRSHALPADGVTEQVRNDGLKLVRGAVARGQDVLDYLTRQTVRGHRVELGDVGRQPVDLDHGVVSHSQLTLGAQPDSVADGVVPRDTCKVFRWRQLDVRVEHPLFRDDRRLQLQQQIGLFRHVVVELGRDRDLHGKSLLYECFAAQSLRRSSAPSATN